MERNDNFGSTSGMGENTGAGSGSFGSGSGAAGTPRTGYGDEGTLGGGNAFGAGGANYGSTNTQGGFGTTDAGSEAQGRAAAAGEKLGNAREAAGEKLGNAREAASDKLGTLKEKASNLTATLADKLEAGAERLRAQGGGTGGSMAFAGGTSGAATDDRMGAMGNQLAGGMQGAADWLREGDLRATVEQQVKEHPGRTLLIALGVGYVLGKAFRK